MQAEWTERRPRAHRFLAQWLSVVLLLLGTSLLGVGGGYVAQRYHLAQALSGLDRGAGAFEERRAAQIPLVVSASEEPVEAPEPAFVGSRPVRLVIPSIGIDSPVDPVGTTEVGGELVWEVPDFTVGYYRDTALPGERGNAVMAGHVDPINGQGAVFHNLPEIQPGDEISVATEDGRTLRFVVDGTMVVTPYDTWVMDPTGEPTITLITCVPSGIYTHRFVATASLVVDDEAPPALARTR